MFIVRSEDLQFIETRNEFMVNGHMCNFLLFPTFLLFECFNLGLGTITSLDTRKLKS